MKKDSFPDDIFIFFRILFDLTTRVVPIIFVFLKFFAYFYLGASHFGYPTEFSKQFILDMALQQQL